MEVSTARKKVDNKTSGKTSSANLRYPLNIGDGSFSSCIMFSQWTRTSGAGAAIIPGKTIVLDMPEKASNPSTTSWDTGNAGVAGNAVSTVLGHNNTARDAGNESFMNQAGNILGGIATSAVNSGLKAGYESLIKSGQEKGIGVDISFEDFQGIATKTVPNPYMQILFKGVDFRRFDFSFKLFPHSQREAQAIHEIVKTFRGACYPYGSSGDQSPMLGYPPEFTIEYLYNGEVNNYLHKFKRSVLTKVDVDYTSTGSWNMMRDGFPASIELNLEFSEIQILVDRDILQDGF